MALIKSIKSKEVGNLALSLVKESKKTLHLTMMLSDEISKPFPNGYLELLCEKAEQGLLIKRIGFGDLQDYLMAVEMIKKTLTYDVLFKHCSDMTIAQRMLIADKKKMLFAVYKNKNKEVFYTENKAIIKGFLKYFDMLFVTS